MMSRTLYHKCNKCHLFIDENWNTGPGIAQWVHLHRGTPEDEALDERHEAEPSGLIATVGVWRKFGPPAMRLRFVGDEAVGVVTDPADVAVNIGGVLEWVSRNPNRTLPQSQIEALEEARDQANLLANDINY